MSKEYEIINNKSGVRFVKFTSEGGYISFPISETDSEAIIQNKLKKIKEDRKDL